MSRFPDRYRDVSVTDVDVPLDIDALRALLTSRPVYRRTRYRRARRAERDRPRRGPQEPQSALFCDVGRRRAARRPGRDVVPAPARPRHRRAQRARQGGGPMPPVPAASSSRAGTATSTSSSTPPRGGSTSSTSHRPGRPSWSTRSSGCSTRPRTCPPTRGRPAMSSSCPTCSRRSRAEHYLLPCRGGGMDVPGRPRRYLDEVPPGARLDAARLRPLAGDPRLPVRRAGPADRHLPTHPRPRRAIRTLRRAMAHCSMRAVAPFSRQAANLDSASNLSQWPWPVGRPGN